MRERPASSHFYYLWSESDSRFYAHNSSYKCTLEWKYAYIENEGRVAKGGKRLFESKTTRNMLKNNNFWNFPYNSPQSTFSRHTNCALSLSNCLGEAVESLRLASARTSRSRARAELPTSTMACVRVALFQWAISSRSLRNRRPWGSGEVDARQRQRPDTQCGRREPLQVAGTPQFALKR